MAGMGTSGDLRLAGLVALVTAVLMIASLVLFSGGPPSPHPNAVLAWYGANAVAVKGAALMWMLAMLGLVAFAVRFREAMWATVADRPWVTVVFLHGAVVFATVAVVSAAVAWALAEQARGGRLSADLAGSMWALERTLLRFATWGFTVPLLAVGLALYRHSLLGQLCTLAGLLVAVTLVVPLTWGAALYAFPVWLAMTGVALLVPASGRDLQGALR
jgi:hypothetical protein